MKNLEQSILNILRRGTKIVSFDYNGKARNVLIGAKEIEKQGTWGEQLNRAIRVHGGVKYLVARVQNEGPTPTIKAFQLDLIENPSF
jgi:hypothetical protein